MGLEQQSCWKPPSKKTRDFLVGFKANATFLGDCRERDRMSAEAARGVRQSLPGNAMHAGVVAALPSDCPNKFLIPRALFAPSQRAFQERSTRHQAEVHDVTRWVMTRNLARSR